MTVGSSLSAGRPGLRVKHFSHDRSAPSRAECDAAAGVFGPESVVHLEGSEADIKRAPAVIKCDVIRKLCAVDREQLTQSTE